MSKSAYKTLDQVIASPEGYLVSPQAKVGLQELPKYVQNT